MAISEGGIGLNIGRQEKTVSTRFLTPGLLKSGASTVWSGRFLLSPPLFGILSSMMTIATFSGDVKKEKNVLNNFEDKKENKDKPNETDHFFCCVLYDVCMV